jgi:hypothetical protein
MLCIELARGKRERRGSRTTSNASGGGRISAAWIRRRQRHRPHALLVLTTGSNEPATEATLTVDGDHTILIVQERGMPLDQLAGYGAGGQIHTEDLAGHVTGNERREREARQRWEHLVHAYEDLATTSSS